MVDLLRGDSALLDAAKKGNLSRVHKLLTQVSLSNLVQKGLKVILILLQDNINCRDSAGRNSTPLHLAAGYNNLEVADHLLEQVLGLRDEFAFSFILILFRAPM